MKRNRKVGSGQGWDGGPKSRFQRLREAAQLSLLLKIKPPYDPRRHPYVVTGIGRKNGRGFEPDDSGILIYFDVRAEVAAGLRCGKTGAWLGDDNAE